MSHDMTQEVLAVFREEAVELVQRALAALNRAVNSEGAERTKQVNEVCRQLHTLKGAAAAVDEEDIKDRTHVLEDRVAELSAGKEAALFDPVFAELEALERELKQAEAAAQLPRAVERPRTPPRHVEDRAPSRQLAAAGPAPASEAQIDPGLSGAEWLRVAPERIENLHALLGEMVLTRLRQDQLVERMVQLSATAARVMKREREMSRVLLEARSELTPESWRRLRTYTKSTSTSWSGMFESLQSVCREARVLQGQSGIVSQSVEESIQNLRLMPLAPFFEGYAKAARDAGRRAGRLVRFHVKADGTEVDRAVLTRLSDALLHLVRNAVAHGIESPDQRQRLGKAAEGVLTLEAWSAGTQAVIRVADDGAGVDGERVRQKARSLGIDDGHDVLDILTHPGFSTRDAADELSGRGVGLDVVRAIVHALGGSLELHSQRGVGTVFTIRVPIAASTSMGLILEVEQQRFGIMLGDVERVLRPGLTEISDVEGKPAIRVQDELVALVALADVLGIKSTSVPQERVPVVVISQGRQRLGLMVSDIPGEHALVVKPFGRAFANAELFIGGAVQPDHSVVPVLATPALFARAVRSAHASLKQHLPAERPRVPANLHALVVDDSITMRTLLRNVLHAAGYQVTLAEDGVSALDRLAEMHDCQILITDLQMPQMDGIELCRNVRARGGKYVPIVMVTSVDDDDEKSRALTAGADAYIVKASFEQTAFLRRVDTLVRGPT
jgi:two-component system chemotaxis sensor kinase CheA